MPGPRVLEDFAHALRVLSGSEDDEIEAWDRRAVFDLARPTKVPWEILEIDNPPETYLLMIRSSDDEKVYELLWRPERGIPLDQCPIVSISEDGDAQVVAGSSGDWIDALIYTHGRLGGGSEEDFEDALEFASTAARQLSEELADDLDREPGDPENMSNRWEKAQERWADAWADASEGLD
jgi:hypothetical protein